MIVHGNKCEDVRILPTISHLRISLVLFVLHFFVFLVILGRRVCRALVPNTLAFDLPTSINSPLFGLVFLCFSLL